MSTPKSLLMGRKAVLEAIRKEQKIDKIIIAQGTTGQWIYEISKEAAQRNIRIQRVPSEKMYQITRKAHDGVVAFLALVTYYDLQSVIDLVQDRGEDGLYLILDGITDVRNIGAIIRSAYSYGVHALIVPENGVAPLREDAMKTSAGALPKMTICRVQYLHEAIHTLKLNGVKVIGSDLESKKVLGEVDVKMPCAIVLGSEDKGVGRHILKNCDETMKIPMKTDFDSLNVSVATGIILYHILINRHSFS